jgi:hypothetical protein
VPSRSPPIGSAPNRDIRVPEADMALLNAPPAAPGEVGFDDRATMAVGSLGFGLAIPRLTGLFGPYGARDGVFWLGMAGFIALASAIWLGNRWLLFKQREHFDWFNHPLRKLLMLVVANVLYTAPITVLGLLAWFAVAGLPVDRTALQVVVLTNVICVLFVTHGYETMFLIRERESDLLRVERLDRLRVQAELAALKTQVDPHFLFNSLNTLGHLIQHDARRGREFCDTLADVYRYVLDSGRRDLVPLADELAFVRRYHRLLELRSGGAIRLAVGAGIDHDAWRWRIPPLALQALLENAVKHNQASADEPLELTISLCDGDAAAPAIRAVNARRPRRSALPSAGVGLANLAARCSLATGAALAVRPGDDAFEVDVPLRAAA